MRFRATDVQPSAALMLWGEKPTMPAEEITSMRYRHVDNSAQYKYITEAHF